MQSRVRIFSKPREIWQSNSPVSYDLIGESTRSLHGFSMEKSQQRCFQFKECTQKFVRLNDVAATVPAMRVNDPAPAISGHGAPIGPTSSRSTEVVRDRCLVISLAA